MKILTINCGSSSIKYQLFNMPSKEVLAKGLIEKIGEETSRFIHQVNNEKYVIEERLVSHKDGLKKLIAIMTDNKIGVLKNLFEIGAIGHRVVHGGESYSNSVIIDESVIGCITDVVELAPLHNPHNLIGIQEAKAILPDVQMVAVFDTAFHQTLPAKAFIYALPYEFYSKYKIRRYGFHGSSHAYVAHRAAELLKKPLKDINLITCHLGNGCSMAAIKRGESVDTTMGLTPLEGLAMGTRCGDIDPAIIFYLLGKKEYSDYKKLDIIFNKQSGLLGVSGTSNDMRNLIDVSQKEGEESRSQLAIDIFCYKLKKYIGSYMAVLGKTDAVIFTGGIGENAPIVRKNALTELDLFGLKVDEEKNAAVIGGREGEISLPRSATRIFVIPTDEEGWIAAETYKLCKK